MLELQHLEYLTVIAEEGTMSAAAERLHLSQPALSRSMQRLEATLGLSLFDRGKNRVELNEAGLLAVAHAKAVLSVADEMEQRMEDYKKSLTTITIGSCAPGPLWQLSPEVSGRFPGMTLATYLKEEGLLEDLQKDTCQIAILDHPEESPGLNCRPYVAESLSILLPKHHPLASKSGLYLSDLDGITMLNGSVTTVGTDENGNSYTSEKGAEQEYTWESYRGYDKDGYSYSTGKTEHTSGSRFRE